MDGLVDELAEGARAEMAVVEEHGGAVEAVGYMKTQLVESHRARVSRIERGELKVIGQNVYTEHEPSPLQEGEDGGILTVDPAGRAVRDRRACRTGGRSATRRPSTQRWPISARRPLPTTSNVMPATLAAAQAGATTGEWAGGAARGLRRVPGAHRRRRRRGSPGRRVPRRAARPGRARLRGARAPDQDPGRQARAGRPLQRRRADRRARPRRRDGRGLRGHPPDPRADRRAPRSTRACTWSGLSILSRLARRADPGGARRARAGRRRRAGGGRRDHPAAPTRSACSRRASPASTRRRTSRSPASWATSWTWWPSTTVPPPRAPDAALACPRMPRQEKRAGRQGAAAGSAARGIRGRGARPQAARGRPLGGARGAQPDRGPLAGRAGARRRAARRGLPGRPGRRGAGAPHRRHRAARARASRRCCPRSCASGGRAGRTVAVLAVDPSSKRSGGSLLGDRARIDHDPKDDGILIRSTAAAGRLGGLAAPTREAATALAPAFDVVVVETVGVGQSETDVEELCDTVAVVVQPGSGRHAPVPEGRDHGGARRAGGHEGRPRRRGAAGAARPGAGAGGARVGRARRSCRSPRCPRRRGSTSWSRRSTPTASRSTCRPARLRARRLDGAGRVRRRARRGRAASRSAGGARPSASSRQAPSGRARLVAALERQAGCVSRAAQAPGSALRADGVAELPEPRTSARRGFGRSRSPALVALLRR